MARYAFSIYGESLYGAPILSVFAADPVLATPVDYGQVLLTWHPPGGVWDELRVIRNYLGYPVSVDNGDEIFTTTPTASGSQVNDSNLKQDHWVYYTIFVHVTADDEWVRSGLARCFVPSDYGGADRMLSLVPEVLHSDTLTKFMGVLGYAYDLLRNDVNSLLDLYDSMSVSYDLVPVLLEQFGIPIEPELEPEQYRRYLRNAAFLYKVKGTAPCVHGIVASVTGWQCTVSVGANLLWTSDASDFAGGLSAWQNAVNATVDWIAPAGGVAGAGRVTAVATAIGSYSAVQFNERIPLTAAEIADHTIAQYSVSALVRADQVSTSTARVSLDWYDAAGTYLSSTLGTAVMARQGVDTVVRVTGTAPLNAASVTASLVVLDPTAAQRWEWRQVMVNRGGALPYEPGHDIRIALSITDTDPFRQAVHLDRLSKILPRYLPLGATFTLLF